MSKCKSRTSLHAIQYMWHSGCSNVVLIILEMAGLDTLCVNRHLGVNSLFAV